MSQPFEIPPPPPLPDYMGGINQAYADNQALGQQQAQQKPKFDFGQFLAAWAGHLGDNLTGNPVYSNAMQNRSQSEAQARAEGERRRAEQDWWYEQQRYKAANEKPDTPEIADQWNWYSGLSPEQRQQVDPFIQMMRPGMQSPMMIPHDYEQVNGGQQPQAGPPITATGPNGEKIRFNPQSNQWEPMGGSGGNVGGGFL